MTEELGAQITKIYATPGSLEAFNGDIVAQFRSNKGEIGSGPLAGAPLLLLTLNQELIPLAYVLEGGRYVIAAPKGGAPNNPRWYDDLMYDDLMSAGEAFVEVGTESFTVAAMEVSGAESDRLYSALAEEMPTFDQYDARTSRVIPAILLGRRA